MPRPAMNSTTGERHLDGRMSTPLYEHDTIASEVQEYSNLQAFGNFEQHSYNTSYAVPNQHLSNANFFANGTIDPAYISPDSSRHSSQFGVRATLSDQHQWDPAWSSLSNNGLSFCPDPSLLGRMPNVAMPMTPPPDGEPAPGVAPDVRLNAQTSHFALQSALSTGISAKSHQGPALPRRIKPFAPALSEHAQNQIMIFIQDSLDEHMDPAYNTVGIKTLARLLGIDALEVMRLVATNAKAVSPETYTLQGIVPPSQPSVQLQTSSEDTKPQRQAIANDFFASMEDITACNYKRGRDHKDGMYRCPYSSCDFSHETYYEWQRHLLKRQPQHCYVCYLCPILESPNDKVPHQTFRKDKHEEHLRTKHKILKNAADHTAKSCFDAPPNHFDKCPICQDNISSWKHQLSHLADHYKKESDIWTQEAARTSPGASRSSSKRSSSTGESRGKRKR